MVVLSLLNAAPRHVGWNTTSDVRHRHTDKSAEAYRDLKHQGVNPRSKDHERRLGERITMHRVTGLYESLPPWQASYSISASIKESCHAHICSSDSKWGGTVFGSWKASSGVLGRN